MALSYDKFGFSEKVFILFQTFSLKMPHISGHIDQNIFSWTGGLSEICVL